MIAILYLLLHRLDHYHEDSRYVRHPRQQCKCKDAREEKESERFIILTGGTPT